MHSKLRSTQRNSFLFFIAGFFMILAACTPTATPVVITGTERDSVLAYSEQSTDNLLAGLNNNDYATFSRDFDATMLKSIDATGFTNLYNQVMSSYGKYISRSVEAVQTYEGYIRLVYQGDFEKNDSVIILVVFEPTGDHKIAGLFFTQ